MLVVSVTVAILILTYGLLVQELPGNDDERGLVLFYFVGWLIAVVVGWTYEVVLVGWKGKTLGKWAAGVEVARAGMSDAPGVVLSIRRAAEATLLVDRDSARAVLGVEVDAVGAQTGLVRQVL